MNEDVVYDNHQEEWDDYLSDAEKNRVAMTWLEQSNTLDRWRHNRMYRLVEPIIRLNPDYKWLTVGDGRYGTDANALIGMGAKDVHCSDISDTLLKLGNEHGFINDFSAQNAESLTFESGAFDFVFCKEAYHHFPRPQIALHEMLRVSKVGVVLIEPNDQVLDRAPAKFVVPLAKRLLGRRSNFGGHDFEPVGNYLFSISRREMEKVQLGMHRRFIAFTTMSDYYEKGFEFIDMETADKAEHKRIRKARRMIKVRDWLARLGVVPAALLVTILFKQEPDRALVSALESSGWEVKELPKNPYI